MIIGEIEVLRWLHILAMVYWLGGEWGVFQTSYNVVNPRLSLDERRRHMETAYRIDILARTGIILLLPLGLHMGTLYGFVPLDRAWLAPMWGVFIAWLSLTWAAFFQHETDLGIRLTKIDEALRYILIPALLIVGVASLLDQGPLAVGEGTLWYPAKITVYGLMLVIGLGLRFIMRAWTTRFRRLAEGPNPREEAALKREIAIGRGLAYVYWIGIASAAFLGAVKPF
ncbi:hypothetical protein [Brevundimonas sp.]|uniref:hypothetical protein n=1 Tax=Brevundimonas sp. TaxID=1871086 RepID=UPI00391A5037